MNLTRALPATLAFMLFCAMTIASAAATAATAAGAQPRPGVPRVTIVARRMTIAEKARFDLIERRTAAAKERHSKAVVVARQAY